MFFGVLHSEVKPVIQKIAWAKSPGLDRWTTELFIECFDLMGPDLLAMVEDTRITGRILVALNATFIALIPKTSLQATFEDFRSISLCSLVYKLVAKIIANRMKLVLSRHVSKE